MLVYNALFSKLTTRKQGRFNATDWYIQAVSLNFYELATIKSIQG